ncbi:MAG: cob(I)yrinic acid a,c-diamide adenosyltransferase [Desulfobacteraceae bacterium]|nr:cob(I)yrinic acid a,c-diamide adenosyltransferase [Desulfobacteraceae bacterium]
MRGYVQVYTGNGKGKTTAAIGLAVRAAGAGMKTYIGQFIKMGDYSEIKALSRYADWITVEQFGKGRFVEGKPIPEDIDLARIGLQKVRKVLASRAYQIVILEEANVAVKFGLLAVGDLEELITSKPTEVELVITGRFAHHRIIALADLVTEMKAIKHYYHKGVESRVGIES